MPDGGGRSRAVGYDRSVFVNCPFDDDYKPIFDALVFAVLDCGFRPRCTLEAADAGQVRIEKIVHIIRACRFGIHDISRTELNSERLPRFNMPFELGLYLGAQRFGDDRQRRKTCLVLDRERYRYQKFLSDIAGQDIGEHGGDPTRAIKSARDWLASEAKGRRRALPGGAEIARRYECFRSDLPLLALSMRRDVAELTFTDFAEIISVWLREELLKEGT